MSRGKLIIFEGVDGSGTTTQVARLKERMMAGLMSVHATAQPSSGPVGNMIRQILKGRLVSAGNKPPGWSTMALLFAADRQDQQENEIGPHLENGVHVVCDRYVQSSIVYQGVSAGEPDAARWIGEINRHIVQPDVVFYLRIGIEDAEKRRLARNEPAEIFDGRTFQEKLIVAYERLPSMFPGVPVIPIDARLSVEEISNASWRVVSDLLNGRE